MELGCHDRKSLTLKFPTQDQVPKLLHQHFFLRGYFDGDGSISGKLPQFCMLGTKQFCTEIQKILVSELGFNKTKLDDHYANDVTSVRYKGMNQTRIFKDWLYEDSTIHLSRKYDKFQSYYRDRLNQQNRPKE